MIKCLIHVRRVTNNNSVCVAMAGFGSHRQNAMILRCFEISESQVTGHSYQVWPQDLRGCKNKGSAARMWPYRSPLNRRCDRLSHIRRSNSTKSSRGGKHPCKMCHLNEVFDFVSRRPSSLVLCKEFGSMQNVNDNIQLMSSIKHFSHLHRGDRDVASLLPV